MTPGFYQSYIFVETLLLLQLLGFIGVDVAVLQTVLSQLAEGDALSFTIHRLLCASALVVEQMKNSKEREEVDDPFEGAEADLVPEVVIWQIWR